MDLFTWILKPDITDIVMKRIIFVRHGELTENKASTDNKSYDPNNITLTDEGDKQAQITGKIFI